MSTIKYRSVYLLTALLLTLLGACGSGSPYEVLEPERFEGDISRFEKSDAKSFPKANSVLFLGSSSIRYWSDTLESDMSPIPVIARGFGGSNMNDVIHYMNRILQPYNPRAVVLYVGENDIVHGVSPEEFLNAYQLFVKTLHESQPNTKVYFISIKPTPARQGGWKKMQIANRLINTEAESDPLQYYIDIATPMLDASNKPKADIFLPDGIHMNRNGYEIWTSVIKPVLMDGGVSLQN